MRLCSGSSSTIVLPFIACKCKSLLNASFTLLLAASRALLLPVTCLRRLKLHGQKHPKKRKKDMFGKVSNSHGINCFTKVTRPMGTVRKIIPF